MRQNSADGLSRVRLLLWGGTFAHLASSLLSCAGNFSSDFNSGLPAGTAVYGSATVASMGGFTNSGCVQLTTATASLSGGFIIDDLDAGQPLVSFTATYKALIGEGTGADGMSFNFANDLPDGAISEEGSGNAKSPR